MRPRGIFFPAGGQESPGVSREDFDSEPRFSCFRPSFPDAATLTTNRHSIDPLDLLTRFGGKHSSPPPLRRFSAPLFRLSSCVPSRRSSWRCRNRFHRHIFGRRNKPAPFFQPDFPVHPCFVSRAPCRQPETLPAAPIPGGMVKPIASFKKISAKIRGYSIEATNRTKSART
jgi:hypothetical protein